MPLFTIIVDYLGGTYLSQVNARHVDHVLARWAGQLDVTSLGGLTVEQLGVLNLELRRETEHPVRIRGLVGVWCMSIDIEDRLALINIVETAAGTNSSLN